MRALDFVTSSMKLGLGTGSTAAYFIDALGARVKAGLNVVCVPTSVATRMQAERLGIPLSTLDELKSLDMVVDGADECDNALNLIKGGGGALLYEKIVACASKKRVIIADSGKMVAALGRFPLPIEIVKFGAGVTRLKITEAFAGQGLHVDVRPRLAKDGAHFVSDEGNLIVDCVLIPQEGTLYPTIHDAPTLAKQLSQIAGIVEHGLFVGIADFVLVGKAHDNHVEVLECVRQG